MPTPTMRWRHVIINTHRTWLHGDKRGFRSRKHRIHSSGDYKNPPPAEEHAGLHDYHEARSGEEVHIDYALRPIIGRAICRHFITEQFRVVAVAVAKVHAHLLVELPDSMPRIKAIVGDAKRVSSRSVKKELPGTVWSAGGTYKQVNSKARLRSVHDYIVYDQGVGAWTWSYEDSNDSGMFARVRPE